MKKLTIVVLLSIFVSALTFIVAPRITAQAQKEQTCTYSFEAGVLQGASIGTKIMGTAQLNINPDGTLSGMLTGDKDMKINIVGQVSNFGVNMTFELEKANGDKPGRYMFGAGTSWTKIIGDDKCGTNMGGTFSAPKPGDIGYWELIYIQKPGH